LSTSIVKNVTNCYYYNVQNKLVKIVGTNFVNEFQYNSRNERIAVGIGPSTNALVWRYDACQGPVTLAEFNINNEMTRWYVRGLGVAAGIGDVIAEVEVLDSPAKPHYYLSNHRGDTLVVLNPDGAANSSFRYDAFGNCYATNGPFTPRYTFSTKEFLPQAQLYLYQHRVCDVAAGRWTQRDPIDYQDSLNPYQFCGNNPLNEGDETGREVNKVDKAEAPQPKDQPNTPPAVAWYQPGKTPPGSWHDPGKGWEWDSRGYYKDKRGNRKHFHRAEPKHGPAHWDLEDKKGRKTGKEPIPDLEPFAVLILSVAVVLTLPESAPVAAAIVIVTGTQKERPNETQKPNTH